MSLLFLSIFLATTLISCAVGPRAAHSSKKATQQLDFEALGDDWGDPERRAQDEVEIQLEDEVPTGNS